MRLSGFLLIFLARTDDTPQQIVQCLTNLGVMLTRLGDRQMILVKHHRIRSDAGLRAGFVDDAETVDIATFEISLRSDAKLRCVIPVPVVEIAQMRVMRPQRRKAGGRTENRGEIINQRGEIGALVRRCQEQDRRRTPADRLSIVIDHVVVGVSEDLLGQQAAEAVADEDDRALTTEALVEAHEIQHLPCAVRQRHALTRITPALTKKPGQPAERFTRIGGVFERPHAYVGEVPRQPVRPGGVLTVAMPPRPERIPAQAVDEDHVRLALRIVAGFRNSVQLRHPSPLFAAWPI